MAASVGQSIDGPKEHNAYLPGYRKKDIRNHEWRTAENSSAYLLPTLKSMVQAKPHLKLLDCGAGPGTITASLAKYMPDGQVIATDLSEEVMQRAVEHARSVGATNMHCQAASIYDLPFPDNHFDIVHAQQVLCHLDAPLEAITSMIRVTRPGGVVALRECDMRMWSFYPELPALVAFHQVLMRCMDAAGGSNTLGPRLVNLALQAGVPRDRIQASYGTWCYSTRDEREVWGGCMASRIRNGEMRKKTLELGQVSEEELDRMGDAWDQWIETEDASFGCMHGEVLITK